MTEITARHDESCCMNGIPAASGPHPDCPGVPPPNFGPCRCECSCWSHGYDGMCDACRMDIHASDRPRPKPVLVTAEDGSQP